MIDFSYLKPGPEVYSIKHDCKISYLHPKPTISNMEKEKSMFESCSFIRNTMNMKKKKSVSLSNISKNTMLYFLQSI